METSTSCLVNVDGINYKIDLKIKNGEKRIDLDSLKKHLSETNEEELSQYDIFNSEKYTIEIFDPHFQEFVQADNSIELLDKTKLRVKSVDIRKNTQPPIVNGHNSVEDEVLLVKDFEDKRDLVNIVTKLHMSFALMPNRARRRSSNHILEESLKMKEKFWSSVAEEMTTTRNKNFTPDECSTTFFGLLSQYQYILRKYKRYTDDKVQSLWPFFKSFHFKIECKLFAKGLSNLKNSFDSMRKDGGGNQTNKQKTSECTRLEEDFNLITSVLTRINSFRKPPRAAVWKSIGEDMVDYNSLNSRMAGFRWQKRFHELLTKYVHLSSQGSQLDKESWPLYNLFSQIDIGLFMKSKDGNKSRPSQRSRSKRSKNHTSGSSPIPIDLSDSESEFVVIDEIIGESDRDTPCVDLEEEEEINDCVQELVQEIVDKVIELMES
ncbi:uncharacterized protein LOC128397126 [Panonychus citri]|uniref:uncharacterized protein LOC128397126 n=1 Tax=Panonychus citri TaxID=50023 RepID=UPI0023083495|nr:uncharacterized protein LOC128397126 [Panonychus citri]